MNNNWSMRAVRNVKPRNKEELWNWLYLHTGVKLARAGVCEGHSAQWDVFSQLWFDQPDDMLILGSRGSGKSYLFGGIRSHMRSRFFGHHGTRILGGAKSQARQVLNGFREGILDGKGPTGSTDKDTIDHPGVERITYKNGSEVEILTASATSVRGPHIPDLFLDEVDEIEADLRSAAYGMVMKKGDDPWVKPTIVKTSTWHNLGGEMGKLVADAKEKNLERPGSYPFHTFCSFDILARCPDELSGPNLENCHACPIVEYCHSDRDKHNGVPKAKRGRGHYTVQSLIQKMNGVPLRVFEADYLCSGPRAEGMWFPKFEGNPGKSKTNVSTQAEYDPSWPVSFTLDTGLHTGACFFQIKQTWVNNNPDWLVTIFADHYSVGELPEYHVQACKKLAGSLCNDRMDRRWTDPAGDQRNNLGVVILGEYAAAGMTFERWPDRSPCDRLTLVEALVRDAAGNIRLLIHPRCLNTIHAFQNYERAIRAGQYEDKPKDPQHPQEDIMDAFAGGLIGHFPDGRLPAPKLTRVHGSRVT